MGSKASVRHYFAEGFTLRGYISLLPSRLPTWERAYVLLGGPGTGKSTLIKGIGLELLDRGYELDFLRSVHDPDAMAGFILPRQGITMLDALKVSPLRWNAPGIVERFVDFSLYTERHRLEQRRGEIMALQAAYAQAQNQVEEGMQLEFGERLRKKPTKYDPTTLASGLEEQATPLLDNAAPWSIAARALAQLQRSTLHPCFVQGLTSEGWLNLAPYFLGDCDQIHLEGEETPDALNWLLREVQHLGQVVDIVLHPLDPDEIIGIVFPERHLAIWQGNPERLQDQGLKEAVGPNLKEALAARARIQAQLKGLYTETVDFIKVDSLREQVLNEILRELEVKDLFS